MALRAAAAPLRASVWFGTRFSFTVVILRGCGNAPGRRRPHHHYTLLQYSNMLNIQHVFQRNVLKIILCSFCLVRFSARHLYLPACSPLL